MTNCPNADGIPTCGPASDCPHLEYGPDKAVRSHLTPHGPDGQGVAGGPRAPEPSLDDAVYVFIVRSAAPLNGLEAKVQAETFREAGVEPTVQPHVVAVPLREATANHHDALKALGFAFWTANEHFPVVSAGAEL